jgi:hypothetical protein
MCRDPEDGREVAVDCAEPTPAVAAAITVAAAAAVAAAVAADADAAEAVASAPDAEAAGALGGELNTRCTKTSPS